MDIQDVISYWQAFRAECFEMLKEGTENDKRTAEEQIPVCDDTITVLQEQAEREKGCEYCCGEIEVDTPFCPYCGKRLK